MAGRFEHKSRNCGREFDSPKEHDIATCMEMGFTREKCIEALHAHKNIEQALDYLAKNSVQ